MNIYLVRHAEYASDVIGHEDYNANAVAHITALGTLEARALGKTLKRFGVDHIFHSPFERAKETATIVAQCSGAPVTLREDLHEHRIIATSPDRKAWKEQRDAIRNDHALAPNGSESFAQAAERYIHALDEIRVSGAQRPCVVAHALVMQAAISTLFALPKLPHLDTASITTIRDVNGSYQLIHLNERTWSTRLFWEKLLRRLRNSRVA